MFEIIGVERSSICSMIKVMYNAVQMLYILLRLMSKFSRVYNFLVEFSSAFPCKINLEELAGECGHFSFPLRI